MTQIRRRITVVLLIVAATAGGVRNLEATSMTDSPIHATTTTLTTMGWCEWACALGFGACVVLLPPDWCAGPTGDCILWCITRGTAQT